MTGDAVTRVRPTPLAFLAVGWLAVIDAVNQFTVGPATLSAALTGVSVVVMLLVAVTNRPDKGARSIPATPGRKAVPLALKLFALWAIVVLPFSPTLAGAQNVTVYVGFVLSMTITSRLCTPQAATRLLWQVERVGWLVGPLYLVSVVRGGLGASGIYGARTFSLVAVVLLAVAVIRGRRFLSLLMLLDLLVSLSRTATALGLVVFALALAVRSRSRGRAIRVVTLLTLGLVGAYIAFTRFAPLRDRFQGGDQAFSYGSQTFNVSGRMALWKFTLHSAEHHLWFGGGPGSAEVAVVRQFVTVSHPHEDYLRLLHDFGLVGLALFLIGYVSLMHRTWRNGRQTGEPIHWIAFLSLAGVAGAALTDNVLVYSFVMFPVGVLVGASLSGTSPVPAANDQGTDAGQEPSGSAPPDVAEDPVAVLSSGGRWRPQA